MNAPKALLLFVVIAGSVLAWHAREHSVAARELQALADGEGFIPVQMPVGAPPDTVVIIAPINCPSAGAQRAKALHDQLTARGIPNILTNQYSAVPTAENREGLEHALALRDGEIPVVMVNGLGSNNPTLDDVIAEYRH
jgi:hypothetical protein